MYCILHIAHPQTKILPQNNFQTKNLILNLIEKDKNSTPKKSQNLFFSKFDQNSPTAKKTPQAPPKKLIQNNVIKLEIMT